MNAWKRSAAVIGGMVVSAAVSTARADFLLESQSVSIDNKSHLVDFSLTFNQSPDFATQDTLGPADSFQIDFNGNFDPHSTTAFRNSLTAVVRGDEIHIAGDIPIRSLNGTGGANSGGFGPVVGSVPFNLIGDTVTFSVPTKDLGYTGHSYQYEAISFANGRQTASQFVTAVPTPAAFPSGVVGLILVAGATYVIRRRQI
jgi:hypothetical protein